jgi:PAS domain S-box-containing protein
MTSSTTTASTPVTTISDSSAPAVLLVDDRPDKLMALTAVLSGLDIDLITVNSGKEALRQLLDREFAVILLDVNMPVMDGFETAALIRSRRSSEHTPIIFITGMNDTDNHLSRGYSLGAVDYIFSPVLPEMLRAKVSVFIDLFRKSRELRRLAEEVANEAKQRALMLESRLDALLNRLNVGVFRCTLEGRLVSANPSFLYIFGLHPGSDLQAIDMASFYRQPTDRLQLISRLQREGQVQEPYVQQVRRDGKLIWVSIAKTLILGEDGMTYIDGLIEDLTSRKLAEDALITKSEELARSNARLEQFAYIASHDLQEPLRMVSSFASLLTCRYADKFDEQSHHFLERIVDGATRMQQMIRDILSYSRVDRSDQTTEVDCQQVVERALFNLESIISESQAEIIILDPLPRVIGDAVMLGQVFQNLIANGIKFRRNGVTPRIEISAQRDGACQWFAIADNGIGILPEHRDRVFGVFQRLHTRDAYEGTGIGLAICRKVVEWHGGQILVEGNGEAGSVFRFSVNKRGAHPHEVPPTTTASG